MMHVRKFIQLADRELGYPDRLGNVVEERESRNMHVDRIRIPNPQVAHLACARDDNCDVSCRPCMEVRYRVEAEPITGNRVCLLRGRESHRAVAQEGRCVEWEQYRNGACGYACKLLAHLIIKRAQ